MRPWPTWHNYDLATALADVFGIPVKVANDADVQGRGGRRHRLSSS